MNISEYKKWDIWAGKLIYWRMSVCFRACSPLISSFFAPTLSSSFQLLRPRSPSSKKKSGIICFCFLWWKNYASVCKVFREIILYNEQHTFSLDQVWGEKSFCHRMKRKHCGRKHFNGENISVWKWGVNVLRENILHS